MLVFWFKSQNLICLWNVFVAYSHASNETGNENTAGTLRRNFYWLRPFVGDCKPGSAVSSSVLVFILISGLLCGNIYNMFKTNGWFGCVYLAICILALISCIVIIVAHHQNTVDLKFKVPLVPYLPALSILCNIELMANLNLLTWIRFIVWMAIGLILYFLYGMHHSKLNDPTCTYSVLLTPSGEQQVKWGATVTRIKAKRPSVTTPTDDDTQPIIDNEHRNQ